MKQYFVNLESVYIPKNQPSQLVLSHVATLDRMLINEDDVTKFIEDLTSKISEINHLFPRCKDLELDSYSSSMDFADTTYRIDGLFYLTLMQVKQND